MRMRRLHLLSLVSFAPLLLGGALPAAAKDTGKIKPAVVTRAVIPNSSSDYDVRVFSSPRREALPGQEIAYTVVYGCAGGNATPELRLEVWWNSPEQGLVSYVAQSASDAYGGVKPSVSLSEKKISWKISNFPPNTTSRRVTFKLQTPSRYDRGVFPIEVKVRLMAPPVRKEAASLITVTYAAGVPVTPLTLWPYLQELLVQPAPRFLVSKSSFIVLLLIALIAPVLVLVRFDIRFSFLPFLFFYLGYRLLEILGFKKKPPTWGRIFDEDSRRPLFLVEVIVFDFYGKVLARSFSDRGGSFGFDLPPGRYILEFKKGNFSMAPSHRFLTLSEQRVVFRWEGYAGEVYLRKRRRISFFWEDLAERVALEFSDFAIILGVLLGFANLYLYPSLVSLVMASFYVLLLLFWTIVFVR